MLRKFIFYLNCILITLVFIQSATAQEQTQPGPYHYTITGCGKEVDKLNAKITVETNKPYIDPDSDNNGSISPYLYGSNWASWRKFTSFIIEKALPLNLKIIRLGGNQMSRFNWRSGKLTMPGSKEVTSQPTNVDNFVENCRKLGAEPLIQINAMGWAPNDKNNDVFEKCMTAQDTADLVVYLNKTKGYNVKYFEIDNEYSAWNYTHHDVWDRKLTIEEYTEIFKEYAYAIKKAQAMISSAGDIKIFGPAISESWLFNDAVYFLQECRNFENDKKNNPEGFRILDVLSFHYYPLFRTDWKNPNSFIPEGVPAMLGSVQTWWNRLYINKHDYNQPRDEPAYTIPKFNQYIKKYYPGTELAITEMGVDSANSIKYDPIMEPLYMADLWGVMAKYGVDYAMPHWVAHDDSKFGMISYKGNRPYYYPFMLYSQHFKGTILVANSNKSDLLNVYACDDGENNIVLMVVNKDTKDYNTAVDLIGYKGSSVKNKFYLNFEKYSLTCIKIPKNKVKDYADIWVYGERQIKR